MSFARIGKPRADDETVTLLREIRDLLRTCLRRSASITCGRTGAGRCA
jgi:hypothetical protein